MKSIHFPIGVMMWITLFTLLNTDLNAQWKASVPLPVDTFGVYDLSISPANSNVVWAIGTKWFVDSIDYLPLSNPYLPVTRTTDGGQSWSTTNLSFGYLPFPSNITAIDENKAWVAGVDANTNNFLMATYNGGITWDRYNDGIYIFPTSYINEVYFWDVNNGVAIGDPAKIPGDTLQTFEIYTTSNKGKSWNRVPPQNIPARLPNELGGTAFYSAVGDHIWFGTIDFGLGRHSRVFHSADRGYHWTAVLTEATQTSFADIGNGIAYSSKKLLRTTDSGNTWSEIPMLTGKNINTMALIPDSLFIIASTRENNYSGPFETYLSKDWGQSWKKIGSGELAGSIRFSADGKGYAGEWQPVDHATRMYTYNYKPDTVITQFNKPLIEKMILSPTIAHDEVNIVFLPLSEDATLEIYDISGNKVYGECLVKGNATYTIDCSQYAAGNYSIRIRQDGKLVIGKFIKL